MLSQLEYPVYSITKSHYESSKNELIGSKTKFWFEHKELGYCLYKQVKSPLVGEDWAEKFVSELCTLLGLPHATYHLAKTWEGNRGVVSPTFLPESGRLIHGNEILSQNLEDYPTSATYGNKQYTIDNVVRVIKDGNINLPLINGWTVPDGIQNAVEVFLGYLLLDAWVGNSDRHHENWGFIQNQVEHGLEKLYLTPTYDHSSCLGRELTDKNRRHKQIAKYANKGISAFYGSVEDKKYLPAFDVFHRVAIKYPQATRIWLKRLESISKASTLSIFAQIDRKRISSTAVEFAQNILEFNQLRLLELGS